MITLCPGVGDPCGVAIAADAELCALCREARDEGAPVRRRKRRARLEGASNPLPRAARPRVVRKATRRARCRRRRSVVLPVEVLARELAALERDVAAAMRAGFAP